MSMSDIVKRPNTSFRVSEEEAKNIRLMLKGSRGECEDDEPRSILYRGSKVEHQQLASYLEAIRGAGPLVLSQPARMPTQFKPRPMTQAEPVGWTDEEDELYGTDSLPPSMVDALSTPAVVKPVIKTVADVPKPVVNERPFRPQPKSGGRQ